MGGTLGILQHHAGADPRIWPGLALSQEQALCSVLSNSMLVSNLKHSLIVNITLLNPVPERIIRYSYANSIICDKYIIYQPPVRQELVFSCIIITQKEVLHVQDISMTNLFFVWNNACKIAFIIDASKSIELLYRPGYQ